MSANRTGRAEMPDDRNTPPPDIAAEIAGLRREIERLNNNRFVRIQNSPARLFLFRFTSGLFTGLGTVIGATLLVSLLVYWLQGINWIPVIGDWASQIADRIETDRSVETRNGTPLFTDQPGSAPADAQRATPDTPPPGNDGTGQ